jgi:hypothetical protein
LRITFGADDRLEEEMLSAFRDWIVENAPELREVSDGLR